MRKLEKCPNCGAPLPAVAPGEVEVCPYCHVETREEPRPEPRPQPQPQPRTFERSFSASDDDDVRIPKESAVGDQKGFLIGVAVFVVVAFAGSGFYSYWWKEQKKSALPAPTASVAPIPSVLKLADLRTAHFPEGNEWLAVVAPGMVGTYEAFDVAANYDWASRIATAWSPGAVLFRVLVSRIARDGTVDVSDRRRDGKMLSGVDYIFSAPGAGHIMIGVNDASAYVSTTGGATPHVAILVTASKDEKLDPMQPPFAKPACTLAQAFKAAAKPLAKLDAALTPAGLDPGIAATLLNNGIATRWVISYATVKPGTTHLEGYEAVVNAMTCVLEESR